MIWPWASGAWSFLSRLLDRGTRVPRDAKQDSPKTHISHSSLQPQRPDHASESPSDQAQDLPEAAPTPKSPPCIRYVPVPGEWARKLHPTWPDSTFRVPDAVPEGHIYYVTKGDYVRRGATALVERLPSGHIAKTPLPNPYDLDEERRVREQMEHEYNVYRFIGLSPFIPKLIDWDRESKTLVLGDQSNGDLETYLREHHDADIDARHQWALQASQALENLHSFGIIHQDVTPRNFLLDENLNLYICDFAGSSFPGHIALTGAPGPRYQSRAWDPGYVPTELDDIFGLGSVLYFIMCGEEPYGNLDEDEVKSRFEKSDFPASNHLRHGEVIQSCWHGDFADAKQVVQALVHARQITS
ncbi:hypothetical protein CEP51_015657 [Fusarium floridanum]|uniref:EKC/KEOPS complex subunit BUD32 n=1 Tax=Fusarium floridanum TaxID=1325733 RepID=A0A428P5F1_9HYPO|nr:hypothetical protein CEP51_015657 [Fusarium floridanum]